MKTLDLPEKTADPVISEVRAIKRQIVAEHGDDLDSFFASIRQRQSRNPRLVRTTGGEYPISTTTQQTHTESGPRE